MKKNFLIVALISAFLLTACNVSDDNMALRVGRMALSENSIHGLYQLQIEVYLERPDLSLSQPTNDVGLSIEELPQSLRPKSMSMNGVECDITSFPHSCAVDLEQFDVKPEKESFLIKVTFEDEMSAEDEITIVRPDSIAAPEIIEPTVKPSDGAKFFIKFKESDANIYKISAGELAYTVTKEEEGQLVVEGGHELEAPTVSAADGVIEVSSSATVNFGEGVDYLVTAISSEENSKGIVIASESSWIVSF